MKKILIIATLCVISLGAANAQSMFTTSYSVGFGAGDLGEFISKPSFRGIGFDYRASINPNIGLGFTLGWNVFYNEEGRKTYTVDNVSYTGKQYRYSNSFPMLVSANYYLKPGESLNPFVGLGAGTMYTRRNTDMNLYTLEQEAWHFALTPEVGFHYSIDDATAITVALKYNNGFKAGDFEKTQSYFSLNVGFTFMN